MRPLCRSSVTQEAAGASTAITRQQIPGPGRAGHTSRHLPAMRQRPEADTGQRRAMRQASMTGQSFSSNWTSGTVGTAGLLGHACVSPHVGGGAALMRTRRLREDRPAVGRDQERVAGDGARFGCFRDR
jgi:hypothetical protein